MKLYHHIDESSFEAIKAEGLKPGEDCYKGWRYALGPEIPTEDCVWFSTLPNWYHSFDPPVIFDVPKIKITVDIGRRDGKLLKISTPMHKAGQWAGQSPELKQTGRSFYIHLGTVPPDRIIDVERVVYTFPDGTTGRTFADLEAYRER